MSRKQAPYRSKEEKLKLITECRQSGLSDSEWCRQHGICPSTFYTWISRLREEVCEIPEASYGRVGMECAKQDVVKVDVLPKKMGTAVPDTAGTISEARREDPHSIEIMMTGITIRVKNGADPVLLAQTLRALNGGYAC